MGAVAIKRLLVPTRSCSTIQHLAVCNYHTYAAHIMHLLFHCFVVIIIELFFLWFLCPFTNSPSVQMCILHLDTGFDSKTS